jgi:prepilin-type N-terminal cleavage/methylation domain-containing protein
MTLIELLVVIAILGLLSVAVLPNLTNTSGARKVRETVRGVSSFMAGAQTRALQSRSGAGIWIDILPNQMGSNWAAIDLAVANVADPYAGDTTASKITALSSTVASTVAATFSDTCLPPTSSSYLLRFQGGQTWFKFDPTTSQISLRPELGQTTANTAWPTPPVSYEVVGCPTKDASTSLTVGNGVALDLTNSFVGTTPILQSISSPTRLMVVYDSGAKPSYVILDNAATREPLREPIFLLVADIESIQNGTSLTKPGGFWVAIDPRGGIPRVGEVNTAGATVIEKQSVVRQGLMQYGR